MHAEHDCAGRYICLGGDGCAAELHEEGEDVEPDEESAVAAGCDAGEFLVRDEEVDESAEGHVEEGVDPCSRWLVSGVC